MSVTHTQAETDRFHELCLERIEFFRQKLAEKPFKLFPFCSVEREVFFEDEEGNAQHPHAAATPSAGEGEESAQSPITRHLKEVLGPTFFHHFGSELEELDRYDLRESSRQPLYSWGRDPVFNPKTITPILKPFVLLSAITGTQNKVFPYLVKQYEIEMHSGHIMDDTIMPDFLSAVAHIDDALNEVVGPEGLRASPETKRRHSTFLRLRNTPSMHINVSLWMKDPRHPSDPPLNIFERNQHSQAPDIAERCMRAMSYMQVLGLPFFLDEGQSEWDRFARWAFQNPRELTYSYDKNPASGVCYRGTPQSEKEKQREAQGLPGDYAHIENRIAPANCDPYMNMAMTFGALYAGTCLQHRLNDFEEQASPISPNLRNYRKSSALDTIKDTPETGMLRVVLGEDLFKAAVGYYGLDKPKAPEESPTRTL